MAKNFKQEVETGDEEAIMDLIFHAGNARGLAIEAIRSARKNQFSIAEDYLSKCDQEMNLAHQRQTNFIHNEVIGKKQEMSLLMIHAQDHVMNALTVKDLAQEIILMMEKQDD